MCHQLKLNSNWSVRQLTHGTLRNDDKHAEINGMSNFGNADHKLLRLFSITGDQMEKLKSLELRKQPETKMCSFSTVEVTQ